VTLIFESLDRQLSASFPNVAPRRLCRAREEYRHRGRRYQIRDGCLECDAVSEQSSTKRWMTRGLGS